MFLTPPVAQYHSLLSFHLLVLVDFVLKDPHEIDKEPLSAPPPHRLELVTPCIIITLLIIIIIIIIIVIIIIISIIISIIIIVVVVVVVD